MQVTTQDDITKDSLLTSISAVRLKKMGEFKLEQGDIDRVAGSGKTATAESLINLITTLVQVDVQPMKNCIKLAKIAPNMHAQVCSYILSARKTLFKGAENEALEDLVLKYIYSPDFPSLTRTQNFVDKLSNIELSHLIISCRRLLQQDSTILP